MTLSDFIESHASALIKEWEDFARTQFPGAHDLSSAALRDHAGLMLHTFAQALNPKTPDADFPEVQEGPAGGQSPDVSSVARAHALQRYSQGFTLSQMVAEYRALRASIIQHWAQSLQEMSPAQLGDVVRLGQCLDQAMTDSVSVYMEQVEQSRNLLLGILGHDLRNPLSAVIMSADYLLRGNNLNGAQTKAVSRIANSGSTMKKMVDDLLDFTQTMLKQAMPIRRAAADLGLICQDAVHELVAFHPGRSVRFDIEGNLEGEWDAIRLRQLVSNLAANALQHSTPTGVVRLLATGHLTAVTLEVHNDGEEIPEEVRRTLFKPLMAPPSHGDERRTGSSGMGLGLYIAHEIATAHGGSIAVASAAGEGTRFTVCLPRASPAP